jgi:hypothetical protein
MIVPRLHSIACVSFTLSCLLIPTKSIAVAPLGPQTSGSPRPIESMVAAVKEGAQFLENAQTQASGGGFALIASQGAVLRGLDPVRAEKQEEAAVSRLLELLRTSQASKKASDEFVCATVAFALGELGSFAQRAVPQLTALEKSQNPFVREFATSALKKLK